jgi:hypothetical protein
MTFETALHVSARPLSEGGMNLEHQAGFAKFPRHSAGVEEPLRQICFGPSLTLHLSDESEVVLQKPNLRVRCQVLREIA